MVSLWQNEATVWGRNCFLGGWNSLRWSVLSAWFKRSMLYLADCASAWEDGGAWWEVGDTSLFFLHLVASRGRQSPLPHSVSPSYSAVARSARYNVGRFNYSGRIRPSKRGFIHPGDSFDFMQMFSSTEWISENKMESTVKNGIHHYTNRNHSMKQESISKVEALNCMKRDPSLCVILCKEQGQPGHLPNKPSWRKQPTKTSGREWREHAGRFCEMSGSPSIISSTMT